MGPSPHPLRPGLRLGLSVLLLGIVGPGPARAASVAPVESTHGIVATAHPLATQAGQAMLAAGGNAVDAAVAISLALGVVEPWSSGLGGGGFMVVHLRGETTTWDFRETAPGAATRDMFAPGGKVEKGASTWSSRAPAIPGLARGLVRVHETFGTLPLAVVAAPALSYARDGIHVSPRLHAAIDGAHRQMNEAARRVFLGAGGAVPPVGSLLVQGDLAKTLERFVATRGEDLYTGETAREMVRALREEHGIWTLDDLAGYEVKRREPIRGTYRGYDVASMGPPSSGGVLVVQMLGVLEGFDLRSTGFGAATTIHRTAETMKRAFAMRATGLGDPDFVRVDLPAFLGETVVAEIRRQVGGSKRATPARDLAKVEVRPAERTETSHFGVLMADGDAVACTQTINLRFGSGRVAGSTGIVLNNEMDDFSALPGAPNAFGLVGDEWNAIAAGKRPLSSMTPTLLLRDGRAVGVFGSPGGSWIISTVLQTIAGVVEHGMDASQAVSAPRVHHQWYPHRLQVEPFGTSPDTRSLLETLGHPIEEVRSMGNAMVLWRRPDGILTGAADPRGEGTAGGIGVP